MKNLRLLELFLPDKKFHPILRKVNKSERVLSHLKIFLLTCIWLNSQEYQLFQALLNYKTVLKYLVFLDLGTLARKEFFQVLRQLPTSCNRLHGLSFSISQKELTDANCFPQAEDETTCLEDDSYLQCLEDFKNLKKLHITSFHNLAFLQNAKLPSSLQGLRLEFALFAWENYEDFHLKINPFSSSLKNLANLETLKLWFSKASDKEPPSEKYLYAKKSFIEGLLKNIPRLTQLTLAISRRYYFESKSTIDPIPFDFSHFLACMSHFSGSLEVLDIEDGAGFFRFTTGSLLQPSLHFPKLSSLNITGEISGIDLETVLGLASKIELDKITVESLQKLLYMFLLVAQVKDIEKKQVKIKVGLENIRRNLIDEDYFKENYEEVKKQIKGGDLKNVSFSISAGRKELMFRKEIESFQDAFGKVDIERPFYLY